MLGSMLVYAPTTYATMSTSCISLKEMNGDHPLLWTVFEGYFINTLFCTILYVRDKSAEIISVKNQKFINPSCWFFNSDGYILPLISFSFFIEAMRLLQ